MNWEFIDFFCNFFLEMEQEYGTILPERDDTIINDLIDEDNGWGWYVFISP